MNKEDGELCEAEPFLFLRNESESNDDEWDDTQLIKEYDRAVKKAKRQVLRKIQAEMEFTNAEIQEALSCCSSENTKKSKKKNKTKMPSWTIGSACRAVYSEDGVEYEAEIINLISQNKCIVKFIGYDNEEVVLLKDLMPSLGKEVIDLQIVEAELYLAASEEMMDTEDFSYSQSRPNTTHKKSTPQNLGYSKNAINPRLMSSFQRSPIAHRIPPPPPPPPPPAMRQHSSSIHETLEDDEALNSMLMSWYMCGYYAGYYQRAMKN